MQKKSTEAYANVPLKPSSSYSQSVSPVLSPQRTFDVGCRSFCERGVCGTSGQARERSSRATWDWWWGWRGRGGWSPRRSNSSTAWIARTSTPCQHGSAEHQVNVITAVCCGCSGGGRCRWRRKWEAKGGGELKRTDWLINGLIDWLMDGWMDGWIKHYLSKVKISVRRPTEISGIVTSPLLTSMFTMEDISSIICIQ